MLIHGMETLSRVSTIILVVVLVANGIVGFTALIVSTIRMINDLMNKHNKGKDWNK